MDTGERIVQGSGVPTHPRVIARQRQHAPPDSFHAYLVEIGRIPLLCAADEVRLAHEIEVGVLATERLETEAGLSDADREDLAILVDIGEAAKATLIRSNLRLVIATARRYSGSGVALLDLVQEGNIGLIRAVEKFDYQYGYKFSTYATWWIRQAIARGVADQARAIRIPVHVVETAHRVARTQRSMHQALGRVPTSAELGVVLNLAPSKIEDLLSLVVDPISLDARLHDGTSADLAERVVDDAAMVRIEQVGMLMMNADIEFLIGLVTDREKIVLRMRYGLDGAAPRTLEEIGATIGVTRERVRQLEMRALGRLRVNRKTQRYRDYLS